MSAGAAGWPSLQTSKGAPLGGEIRFQRGIWGKAHGAASDFRWLARSPGLDTASKPEIEVSSGLENLPADSGIWRSTARYGYAAHCYQSRALDQAGRSSFLEKQILQWQAASSTPPATAALILLHFADRLDDSDWWEERNHPHWRDPSFALELQAGLIRWDEQDLGKLVEISLQALRQRLEDPSALAAFYAGLLSNRRPALLEGLTGPLPPLAVGALLLPLPRPVAEQASLLGWLLSSRFDAQAFAQRWSGLACSRAPEAFQSLSELTPQALKAGRLCAQAVLDGDSDVLSAVSWPSFERPASQPAPSSSPAQAPPPRPSKPDQRQPDVRPALQVIEKGGDWDQLQPHLSGIAEPLLPLLRFSLDPKRWWTTPQQLLDGARLPRRDPHSPELKLAQSCLSRIEQEKANGRAASSKQWSIKADILQAACLSLSPCAETLCAVGLPSYRDPSSGDCLVPPLLFFPSMDQAWQPTDDWKEALRLTSQCPYPELLDPIMRLLKH